LAAFRPPPRAGSRRSPPHLRCTAQHA
jgi:hypothetical protein